MEKTLNTSEEKSKGMTFDLPYLSNWQMVLLVVIVNLIFGLLHHYWGLSRSAILFDAAVCGVSTSLLSVFYVAFKMKNLRASGKLPSSVPESRIMVHLPKSAVGLGIVFSLLFMFLTPLITELIMRLFAINTYRLLPFVIWKVAYSGFLSAKVIELAILRFVQKDMCRPDDPPQVGDVVVKNPLPGLSSFKKLFDTVTTDFGFNMLLGLLLGGTLIIDYNVVIVPTSRAGILISGVMIGLIVTGLMVYPIIKQMDEACRKGKLPPPFKHNKIISNLPEKPVLLSLMWIPFMVVFSPLVFWLVFAIFEFETLNFFQFFIIRTLYVTLLTKPVVQFAILRYLQVPRRAQRKGAK